MLLRFRTKFFSAEPGGGAVIEQPAESQPTETEVLEQPAEPGPVPYDRFREVIEEKNQLAAERQRWQVEREEYARREATLLERFTARPAEPERGPSFEEDPVEATKSELSRLRAELASSRKATEARLANADIDRSVGARTFLDPDGTKERLAELFFLAQAQGRPFNAEAEAKKLHEREQKVLRDQKITWAQNKQQAGAATRSVVAAPSPPPVKPPEKIPAWGTKERREYDERVTRETLAEFR